MVELVETTIGTVVELVETTIGTVVELVETTIATVVELVETTIGQHSAAAARGLDGLDPRTRAVSTGSTCGPARSRRARPAAASRLPPAEGGTGGEGRRGE